MIFFLIDLLKYVLGIKVPQVFSYTSTRMALASVTSLLLSIFMGKFVIKKLYELKVGATVRLEDCPVLMEKHEKKKDTPTMGGILILFSMIVSLLLWMNWTHTFTLLLLITTLWIGVVGFSDDYLKLKRKHYRGLSGRKKLLSQLGLSLIVALYLLCPAITQNVQMGSWFTPPVAKEMVKTKSDTYKSNILTTQSYASRLYIPFLKQPLFKNTNLLLLILMALFFMFVITGASNAVNLTDGLDGLAPGCLVMAASALAIVGFVSNNIDLARYLNIPYIEGSGEIAVYLAAFAGACLGFLWYNSAPAQVIMGDTGALPLGAILGVCAVLLKKEILFAIVGGIFVVEALSVIMQVMSYRYRGKKRIFLCAPLHHHYEYKGWAETKVVIRFWIIALLLAILGVATLKFQ